MFVERKETNCDALTDKTTCATYSDVLDMRPVSFIGDLQDRRTWKCSPRGVLCREGRVSESTLAGEESAPDPGCLVEFVSRRGVTGKISMLRKSPIDRVVGWSRDREFQSGIRASEHVQRENVLQRP